MVLLKGINYDYSGQQNTKLTEILGKGQTTMKVENTEGFAIDEYFVIEPSTERAEIIKITTVDDDIKITIAAPKFAHPIGTILYRLPYNQMKFYESSSTTGTYAFITGATVDMTYDGLYTNYDDVTGDTDYYFKRTFYNSTSEVESDIALSDYWQSSDEYLYVNEDQMRRFMQLGKNDFPNPPDMRVILKLAQMKLNIELSSTNNNVLVISLFLLGKSYILRALATKSVAKGYITINAEGRTITKAYQELVLDAENTYQEYFQFINAVGRREAIKTNFMDDTAIVSSSTRTLIQDIMRGTQNAVDFQNEYLWSYGERDRRS